MDRVEQNGPDPKELIRLAKAGDQEAFGKLYELYYTPVYRYIYLRTKSKSSAEDLTQTVFLKVYNSLAQMKVMSVSPLAYFFTVARNTIIDHWRKEGHGMVYSDELLMSEETDLPDTSERAEAREARELIESALGILTEDQQEVIKLKFLSDLSNKDISIMLDKSEEAIRQLQSRALKLLRGYFKREY
jgi:RNA polymerase sigma-70 factor (ECF subfamily)